MTDVRKDPEFQRLEKEAGDLQRRLEEVMKEVEKKFPCDEGWAWCVTAAYTIGRFPYTTERE